MRQNDLQLKIFLDLLNNDNDKNNAIFQKDKSEKAETMSKDVEATNLATLFIGNPFKRIRENKA